MRNAPCLLIVLALAAGCRTEAGDEAITPNVSVHTAVITRETLRRYVTAYGTVEAEPATAQRAAAGVVITPQVAGVIAGVDVVDGQRVARGAVLFRLDSRLAEVAAQRVRQEVEFAEQAYQRQESLLQSAVTSQRALQEAKLRLDQARSELAAAETQLAYHRLVAPLAGTVVHVTARVGQSVDAGSVLASVVDVSRLVVSAKVPSREIAGLRPGLPVAIGSDSAARGLLTLVGKDVDPLDDTYRVLVSVPGGSGLTPGSFTGVRIVAEERRKVLVVPVEALVSRAGEGSWVMMVRGDSAFRTPVTPGLRDGGMVEISANGLAAGATVVTVEAYSLPRETRIRLAGR